MNYNVVFAICIMILISVVPANFNHKKIINNVVFNSSTSTNVSFPDATVLWSYPIGGSRSIGAIYGDDQIFSFEHNGAVIGSNISGDGFADFLLIYASNANNNATLSVVDGGSGKIIWSDNFPNFIKYYLEGTLGNDPLICIITGTTSTFVTDEPFYGPGYLNISMVNGLNGSIIWTKSYYLSSSHNGIFFTTNNTIFASTNPLITTYEIFNMSKAQHNILEVYNITLIGVKNINGDIAFKYSYTTLSSSIYYPPYLSIDHIPGLYSGGIFLTYILVNSSEKLISGIVLISSTGQVIWNVTSELNILILTGGTANAVSIAVGNFTGGAYYNLAFSFVALNQSLSYNFGVEVLNITDGNIVYENLYGPYEDPGLGQFIGSTPFLESEFLIDNASGGYGPLLNIKNSPPLLFVTLFSRTGNSTEEVLAINVLSKTVVWNTTLKNVDSYGGAVPFKYGGRGYVALMTHTTQFIVLNASNGDLCSFSTPSGITDPSTVVAIILSNSSDIIGNNIYTSVPVISSYIKNSAFKVQYNVTLLNPFTNATIVHTSIKPLNKTYSNISYFTTVAYLGFNYYITASLDINYSGRWIDQMYIMSSYNLSTSWIYTAECNNNNPLLISTPSWDVYRLFYPKYGNLSSSPNEYVFPVQTATRFYMLEITNQGKLRSSIISKVNKGYAPLYDTFSSITNGGVPSYYYRWYINGTAINNTNSTFSIIFNNPGEYNISSLITDQINQTTFSFTTVIVYPANKTLPLTYYYNISGFVYNATHTSLSNVSIYVNSSLYGYTNYNGAFSISLPNGSYIINFSKKGYVNYTYRVIVNGYNITNLIITLQKVEIQPAPPSSNANGVNIRMKEIDEAIVVIVIGIAIIIAFLSYPWIKKRYGK
ncbi:MAG: carboxypeptidase regulatory-like domain-containing protein [Thermoplasmata archaeon]